MLVYSILDITLLILMMTSHSKSIVIWEINTLLYTAWIRHGSGDNTCIKWFVIIMYPSLNLCNVCAYIIRNVTSVCSTAISFSVDIPNLRFRYENIFHNLNINEGFFWWNRRFRISRFFAKKMEPLGPNFVYNSRHYSPHPKIQREFLLFSTDTLFTYCISKGKLLLCVSFQTWVNRQPRALWYNQTYPIRVSPPPRRVLLEHVR